MKKWITKLEVEKIIKTYSIRKDEFEPVSSINYCYKSKLVKGYMITLSAEQETGRILVTHTQDNGKRTYIDIWGHDKSNNLCFLFRNLWNQPLSNADYIKDLEFQIEELKDAGRKLQQTLKNDTPIHNARGAGRKPSQERLNAIDKVKTLLESGCNDQDIIKQLGISRATFYRYKKNINN